ncbi:MAG: hypothetical protein AAGC73_02130 [Verrucomicrobiota bacterium]
MWQITEFNFPGGDTTKSYCCDGFPILNYERGEGFFRYIIPPLGYIDIRVANYHEGGLNYSKIDVNGREFIFGENDTFTLGVSELHGFTLDNGTGTNAMGLLKPLPILEGVTINNFRQMLTDKIVPFQDPPSGKPKTEADIQALADQYFPGNIYGFDMAMAIYDWTSASFIRQDLFHQLQYTGMTGDPLDLPTIARVIWGCDYPGYSHSDANFMNQFMMTPATSEQDVYKQLLSVYQTVKPLALAEMNVLKIALLHLDQPTVADYQQLYRGAMPMTGGYTTADFAPSMFEYPGNAGPTTDPLIQSLEDALSGTLAPGKIITTKGPWSFSNDLNGAKVWQNGILITCNPPEGATVWPGCADITPFSLNPGTFEINVPAVTRYRIESYEWTTIKEKPVCHFTMTMLGYSVEPY